MDLHDLRSRLSAIGRRWNVVEGRIKEVQNINNAVFIPAINELRYAGRKLVDAWSIYEDQSLDTNTRRANVEKAVTVVEQYVENAEHDVTDAICVFLHLKIRDLIERYGLSLIREYHPNIFELIAKIDEINDIIAESRRNRTRRNEIYDNLETDYVPILKEKFEALRFSEKTMEMDRIIRSRKAKARFTMECVLFVLAVLGALELFWPDWNDWWPL